MDIQTIRDLLSQGETGKALSAFIDYLKQDNRYKENLLRTLRVLEGEYNAVRQKELKGILPFQEAQREYNETNDALLAILDDVEAGRVPAEAIRSRLRNIFFILFGAAVLTFAVFALTKGLNSKDNCPNFDRPKALHVLLIPFDNLGEKPAKVEQRIQQDISALTLKAKIPVQVAISKRNKDGTPSLEIAERRGKTCQADLVIYGMYKAFDPGDSLRVNMGFKFLKAGGQAGDIPFKTFRDITEVTADRDLESALFSICAMIAASEKNWEFAQRWMDKIKNKEANEEEMALWLAKKKDK